MQTTTMHPTTMCRAAVVGFLLTTAACSGTSDSASNATVTGDTSVSDTSDVEVAPPVTSVLASTTTDETTTIATAADSIAPPTTAAPPSPTASTIADPCAEFRAFGPYGRMMAVEGGTAPTDPACADDVAKAQAAVNVFRTSERTFPPGYRDNVKQSVVDSACDDSGGFVRLKNTYDQPVIWWGAGYTANDAEEKTAVYPFFGVVSQPGEEIAITPPNGFPGPAGGYCGVSFDAFLAPVGDNAADAGLVPAPADDPQASDDPEVWFPALLDYETPPTQASMINEIEDVHSPDVALAPTDQDDVGATTTANNSVSTFCQVVPVSQPGGTQGELTMVLYSWAGGGSEPYQTIQLGVFRRGSDKRWRFVGLVQTVYEFPDPTPQARCDFPLYPLQDYNAPAG